MRHRPFEAAFWLLAAILLFALPLLSFGFGITWDDWHQMNYGRLVLRWFASGGADKEALTWSNLQYYGGTFDALAALLYASFAPRGREFLHATRADDMALHGLFELRHVLNALVGFGAIFYAGLLARRLGGSRAGFLAMAFLALSPRFLGHAMNNPKDIPFAFGYVMALHHLTRVIEGYPSPRARDVVLTGVGAALAVGVRIAGLMVVGYAWVFILLKWLGLYFSPKGDATPVARPLAWLGIITLVGYLGGIVCWPFALVHPLQNAVVTVVTLPHLITGDVTLLFEGRLVRLDELPWYYVPKWMAISSPFFLHAGLILAAGVFVVLRKRLSWPSLNLLLASIVFPLALVLIGRPHLYNGWRHLLFVYPPLVVVAALGWDGLLSAARTRASAWAAGGLLAAFAVAPLWWMVRNHPNEYVYFNRLAGGIGGARGKYELDYWGNCLREASRWLGDYHRANQPNEEAVVQMDGHPMSSGYYLRKSLGDRFIPYAHPYVPDILRRGLRPNYSLVLSSVHPAENFDDASGPGENVLYRVKADGTTLCAVLRLP